MRRHIAIGTKAVGAAVPEITSTISHTLMLFDISCLRDYAMTAGLFFPMQLLKTGRAHLVESRLSMAADC